VAQGLIVEKGAVGRKLLILGRSILEWLAHMGFRGNVVRRGNSLGGSVVPFPIFAVGVFIWSTYYCFLRYHTHTPLLPFCSFTFSFLCYVHLVEVPVASLFFFFSFLLFPSLLYSGSCSRLRFFLFVLLFLLERFRLQSIFYLQVVSNSWSKNLPKDVIWVPSFLCSLYFYSVFPFIALVV